MCLVRLGNEIEEKHGKERGVTKRVLVVGFLLGLVACEPIEVGEPPQFGSITKVNAISSTEVEIQWTPGSDDLLSPQELAYGIWVAGPGETNNLDGAPDFLTGEGAHAYNLMDLQAETQYEIVVRVRDRGSNFSTNSTASTVTTPATGAGSYREKAVFDLSQTPTAMIKGKVFSTQSDLGVILGNGIQWFRVGNNGELVRESDIFRVNGTIAEAKLIPVRETTNLDDLFLITDQGLAYYENLDGSFGSAQTPFEGSTPLRNLSVTLRNGLMEAVAYADNNGVLRFYTLNSDGQFELTNSLSLSPTDLDFALATVDSDNHFDMVTYGSNGLRLALGSNENYAFDSDREISSEDPGTATTRMFVQDGNGDDLPDIYIFRRDAQANETLLQFFAATGSGNFSDPTQNDYNRAFFAEPVFEDTNNDGNPDLIVAQTSSNNAGVFLGNGQGQYATAFSFFGSNGQPFSGFFGNFDGRNQLDLAILSVESSKLTVHYSNSAVSSR